MALQYPILFPWGEDGFHPRIKFQKISDKSTRSRCYLSMKDYYSYAFQVQENEGMTPRLGGRLFQQYMVYAYSSIEQTRLWWFRTHQTILRNELYSRICDSVKKGDSETSNVGKGIILPSGFVGSKRYMQQNFQDALAVCHYVGHPDIFLTMTCNPLWDEIMKMMEYLPGCIAPNCPDIISRVFRLKLDQLLTDIKKHFGVCIGVMFVVEFQKRGLPHVHMLIWLDSASEKKLKENVDKFVSAEIPDPLLDPVGYAAVKEFMIHGPCGLQNVNSPCMKDMRCLRHFPKKYCAKTTFDESGFPLYRRCRQNISVHVRNADLDTAWRVFGFPIHYRSISVERLPFHLPGKKNCTFRANEKLEKVAAREKYRHNKLEAFFYLNTVDRDAHKYTYDEIPQHYVWNDSDRRWDKRKRGRQIGRLCYTHHSNGEPWFLRLLLTKVRGPTSFDNIKNVNGVQFSSFRDACNEYGLLDEDNEWHEVLSQCAAGGLAPQIRQLFVHIIVNCKVTDVKELWVCHWQHMVDDIILKMRGKINNNNLVLNETQLQFFALSEIHELLRSIGKSLKNFDQLPQPPDSYLKFGSNNLIIEETSYDTVQMEEEFNTLFESCNEEQKKVFKAIWDSVEGGVGGLFFVYGSGGCGKTYLWRTLLTKLRSQGKIVLPVSTSGIAATLMPGGRTAHSRFKIPIILDDFSLCNIGHDSDIAELIKQTKLIIWDEAPMQHRYAFECLDRSLRDIVKSIDRSRQSMPFGGISVVLGGDFRQILHVIPHGERGDVVSACITRSRLWDICTLFQLKENMRLNQGKSADEKLELKNFSQWVLDIGDGKISPPKIERSKKDFDEILIPDRFCNVEYDNSVDNMILSTYPDFNEKGFNSKYLSERAILTPTNKTVGQLKSVILEKLAGDSFSYFSIDIAEDFGGTDQDLNSAFPVEYRNSIDIPGLPLHELKLKVGVVVMLMRNLNQTLGL